MNIVKQQLTMVAKELFAMKDNGNINLALSLHEKHQKLNSFVDLIQVLII